MPLLMVTGCDVAPQAGPAVARTPANWRPLDPAATEACALARDAYLGRGPYDARPVTSARPDTATAHPNSTAARPDATTARPDGTAAGDAVVAGIVAASRRSTIAGVRWQGELLERGTASGSADTSRHHSALQAGISSYYAVCASGMWTTPAPE